MKQVCRLTTHALRMTFAMTSLCLCFPAFANDVNPDLNRLIFIPAPIFESATTTDTLLIEPLLNKTGNTLEQSIIKYETAIQEKEQRSGQYDQGVFEDSLALAQLYQQVGEHALALGAFEKAFQITRINNGLYDLTQAETIRGMIGSYLALGDIDKAHQKQEFLFYLQQKNYASGSAELVPAMVQWADWNMHLYLRDRSLNYRTLTFNQDKFSRDRANPHLVEAQNQYFSIIESLTGQNRLDDPRLITTERKVAALNYMINMDLTERMARIPVAMGGIENMTYDRRDPSNSAHFYNGIQALKRNIAYSYDAENPQYDVVAERIMELGDWYLLFDRRAAALQIYEEAFTVLAASSLSAREIEQIMTPGMPLQLPEMVDRLSGKVPDASEYKGYIDVEFSLNKFGMASKPNIIDASEGTVKAIHKELLRTIRSCKFRPRIVAGAASEQDQVQLRYYYAY